MFEVTAIHAREILDSRGFPTVEAEVTLKDGAFASACVPSGASTGQFEALELRDGDKTRYLGKGVLTAVNNINNIIAPKFIKQRFDSQQSFDEQLCALDGTDNKQSLGANAILALSLAFAKACAKQNKQYVFERLAEVSNSQFVLPVPMMNILNGGAHADNNVDIQEFMILPVGASTWQEALQWGVETYHALKSVLKQDGLMTGVGDEGGFAPNLQSNQAALDKIMTAIAQTGLKAGRDMYLGLDVAANEIYHNGQYVFSSEDKKMTATQLIDTYDSWVTAYPIISIEDLMQESDTEGWVEATERLSDKLQLVGDDVFVTNPVKLSQGIQDKIANAILIKLNQIGTLTETLKTIDIAKQSNYNTIISHRSGETEDSFIADLSVGTQAMQIKTGAPARSDRVAKYNQLSRIADRASMSYAGKLAFEKWIK